MKGLAIGCVGFVLGAATMASPALGLALAVIAFAYAYHTVARALRSLKHKEPRK